MKRKVLLLLLSLSLLLGAGITAYADPNDTDIPFSLPITTQTK